jgi:hypothetical protein
MSLRYFPLEDTDFRLKMGLQALKSSWLDPDEYHAPDLTEKKRLLYNMRNKVYAAVEGTEAAQEIILKLVQDELTSAHPQIHQSHGIAAKNDPSLIRAASLIQEDLVLMRQKDEDYILAAACVCFPTGWNLEEKIGRSMHHIHDPVPDLNSSIGDPIDRFFRNLKPGKIVERFNWGLYDSDALFQSADWREDRPIENSITADTIGEQIFFRVERQTLQRLEERDDILFTIRIYNTSLAEVTNESKRARQLQHALKTMGKDMQHYKSFPRYDLLIKNYVDQKCRVA